MNLCPCGARGDPAAECTCSAQRLARYRDKLSRALLDRFDLVVAMPRPRATELAAGPGEASGAVRGRVVAARERLAARHAAPDGGGRRAALPCGRPAAALGSRPRPGRARRADGCGARGSERGAAGACRRGALVPRAAGAVGVSGSCRSRSTHPRRARISSARRRERATPRTCAAFDGRAYEQRLAAAGLRFVGRSGAAFPGLLRSIHDPPPGLFVRGARPTWSCSRVRRSPSSALGRAPATAPRSRGALARELAAAGLVVVSGLARGIDAEAHRGALEAGGTTVAVLGCGIDRDYPAAHAGAGAADRRDGPDRLRVRAGSRAGAVAVPGAEPDRRGPLRRRPSSSRRASGAAR